MPTKIYSANITVGPDGSCITLQKVPVKRLPKHLLLGDPYFIARLIKYTGEKQWNALIPRNQQLPKIKIEFLDYLSDINQEPNVHA